MLTAGRGLPTLCERPGRRVQLAGARRGAGDVVPLLLVDPDSPVRRRRRGLARVRRRRDRQTAAGRRALRARPADRRPRPPTPSDGLCFDLLSSARTAVTTGHDDGVITLDLAESDDVHREQLRTSMDEPYRTLLGHFRHEIGHYYFTVLAATGERASAVREAVRRPRPGLPGRAGPALLATAPRRAGRRRSSRPTPRCTRPRTGPRPSPTTCTSATRSTPPRLSDSRRPARPSTGRWPARPGFDHIIDLWLPLAWALNMINRSMGHPDLYPFVLAPAVLEKMRLIHQLIAR